MQTEVIGPATTIHADFPEGHKQRDGRHGWDDLWSYPPATITGPAAAAAAATTAAAGTGTPKVPDCTVITMQVIDDTWPGDPRTVERRFVAPFARANRETDCWLAWRHFAAAQT